MGAVAGKQLEQVECPLCQSFSSKRLTAVEKHLVEAHQSSFKIVWDSKNNGPKKCQCGCGNETKFLGWKQGYAALLKGHNASIYKIYDEVKAKEISQKRREKLIGQTSWAKGLTKETDERIKLRGEGTSKGLRKGYDEGRIKIWSKGLTKETDKRLAARAAEQKESFASGETVPWAKGLTKETDERISAMALKVSITHRTQHIRQKLDAAKRLNNEEIKSRIEASGKLRVIDFGEYVNDASQCIKVECITCNEQTTSSLRRLQYGRCFNCDPGGSITQHEISSWIKNTLNVNVKPNNRTVIQGEHRLAELDIYIPDHNVAIEYNGLYWHCSLHKSDNYHSNKTISCASSGIRLIHVFEDEWRDKQPIVKSIIKHSLGLTINKTHARKCTVAFLTTKQRKQFFNDNHIDGDTAATVAIGLFNSSNEIVAAISLRHPFHKKYDESIEVARMCTSIDTVVQGGLSKLTSEAKKWAKDNGFKKLLSYVDTRLGSGKSWVDSGWIKLNETTPRFWWTDFHDRFNRFKYKADKSRGMTEAQVAAEANVVKIWGCKNLILELNV
jgi:hypothetical protein